MITSCFQYEMLEFVLNYLLMKAYCSSPLRRSTPAWRNSGCTRATPPCSHSNVQKDYSWAMFVVFVKACAPFFLVVFIESVKTTKEEEDKRVKVEEGRGLIPLVHGWLCNQRWEYYSTKVAWTHMVGLRGTGHRRSRPTSVLSVLQMGGGAGKARAAGVQGGIPAAGLETKPLKCVLKTQRLLISGQTELNT